MNKYRNYIKMKIGIITFHDSHNCGSMLQAFALCNILRDNFHQDAEIIDFANEGSRQMYSLWSKRILYKSGKPNINVIMTNISNLIHSEPIRKMMKDYEDFSARFLKKSSCSYRRTSDLNGIENNYDMLISGGDQVWNIRCTDADDAYFLCFARNVKKVAYSPSLGAMNILKYAKNPDKYRRFLLDYDRLSVREINGQKWLQELTGRNIPIVPDPTLLYSAQEWCRVLPVPEVPGEYIFNYAFSYANDENNRLLQYISDKYHLPVYIIDARSFYRYRLGERYGFQLYEKSGPLAFLGLMKNARLVLTQSFHGTLFAAKFNRNFWSYKNAVVRDPDDDRARCILNQLGLIDRYQTFSDLKEMDLFAPISYNLVNKQLDELHKNGRQFITDFLTL